MAWRLNRVIALVVFVAVLAVQVLVPLMRLSDDRGTRFGWQMYSAVKQAPVFEVHTKDVVIDVDLDDYVASLRLDVDIETHLPRHLCTVIPGARDVTWQDGAHTC